MAGITKCGSMAGKTKCCCMACTGKFGFMAGITKCGLKQSKVVLLVFSIVDLGLIAKCCFMALMCGFMVCKAVWFYVFYNKVWSYGWYNKVKMYGWCSFV